MNKTVRYGVVSSVHPEVHAVRVAFEDEDNKVSDLLPVLVVGASKNQDFALPDIGDKVVCLFLSNGVSAGFCIGSVYSQTNLSPHKNVDVRSIRFEDGTVISYDRKKHLFTIDAKGPINITAAGNINVNGDVIADGISLKNHIHPESIGTQTGPPQ